MDSGNISRYKYWLCYKSIVISFIFFEKNVYLHYLIVIRNFYNLFQKWKTPNLFQTICLTAPMPQLKRANIEIAKLKNALAYAEAIVEAIHEPLVVLHPDLRVRTANHAFYRVFHLIPARTEGKEIYQINDGDWNIPELKSFFEKMSASKVPIKDFELKHNFKNAGKRVMLLNARKIQMEGEEEGMILLVIVDITDRKKYEKQIEKEKNMLAENQRLQDISRQKDDFISMASHELKTPVTSIKAYTELLQQICNAGDYAAGVPLVPKLSSQVDRLIELVHTLLDISKMADGELPLTIEEFDLKQLVEESAESLQRTTSLCSIIIQPKKEILIQLKKWLFGRGKITTTPPAPPPITPMILLIAAKDQVKILKRNDHIDKAAVHHPLLEVSRFVPMPPQ